MRCFLSILLFFSINSYAQNKGSKEGNFIKDLEIPSKIKGEQVIRHTGYTLSYNEVFEQANWVAYELTSQEVGGNIPRTNRFLEDPMVTTGTSTDKDYLKSDLDRGHLAPAADMAWSNQTMKESFYYSNMSPQVPTFNRGIWEDAEELVRLWASTYGSVYVVSGPKLTIGLPTIGPNKVAVPRFYYKVILRFQTPNSEGIGLILPNGNAQRNLKSYFVSIDSVERFTGIDFFPSLPDQQENAIESKLNLSAWIWSSPKTKSRKSEEHIENPTENATLKTVQCISITKKGMRCKKMTTNPSHRCTIHEKGS